MMKNVFYRFMAWLIYDISLSRQIYLVFIFYFVIMALTVNNFKFKCVFFTNKSLHLSPRASQANQQQIGVFVKTVEYFTRRSDCFV